MVEATVFGLVLSLASVLPAQVAPTDPTSGDPAAQFQSGVAQVRELTQKGEFARAKKQLDALLVDHANADYATRAQAEIVELAHRCAFHLTWKEPKYAELVSGNLVKYDPKSGDFEIRYEPGKIGDFRKVKDSELKLVHPAVFVDSLVVEIECQPNVHVYGHGPGIATGLGTEEEFLATFGTCIPVNQNGGSYYPPALVRAKGKDSEVIDKQDKPGKPYDKKATLKVVAAPGTITAYRDGSRLLQAKRTVRDIGQSSSTTCRSSSGSR